MAKYSDRCKSSGLLCLIEHVHGWRTIRPVTPTAHHDSMSDFTRSHSRLRSAHCGSSNQLLAMSDIMERRTASEVVQLEQIDHIKVPLYRSVRAWLCGKVSQLNEVTMRRIASRCHGDSCSLRASDIKVHFHPRTQSSQYHGESKDQIGSRV